MIARGPSPSPESASTMKAMMLVHLKLRQAARLCYALGQVSEQAGEDSKTKPPPIRLRGPFACKGQFCSTPSGTPSIWPEMSNMDRSAVALGPIIIIVAAV